MNHNIQSASFSSSEDENEVLFVPTRDMMSQYNREYSIMVNEVEKFLKESTQCIQRFVSYHNFGVSFNLTQLLANMSSIETSFKSRLVQTQASQQKDPKLISKQRYEVSFNRIIQRMSDLFNDLIDCEVEFKKNYFGIKSQEHSRQAQNRLRTSRSPVAYSVSSMTKSSTSQKIKLQDYLQSEQKQERREAELRATLNERLKPKKTVIQTECKTEYSTTQNLYRLNEKIDQFIGNIQSTRSREQKLIELFNLNRVKKLHGPIDQATMCLTPSNISVISPKASESNEGEEEMDSILQSWRQIRKNSDSYTENGQEGRRFFKKRTSTIRERS